MMWIYGGAYTQGFGHEMEFGGESFLKSNNNGFLSATITEVFFVS